MNMKIFSNVSPLSFEAAVWIFGGYPQVPYKEAVKNLAAEIKSKTRLDEIRPTTIWLLGRKTFGKSYRYI